MRRPFWRVALAAAAVVAILGVAAAVLIGQRQAMDARLLRSFADRNPDDPALVRFAVSRAEPVYRARCAGCHGADMKGDPNKGAADLVDSEWLYGDGRVSQIEQTLLYGIRSGDIRSRNLADMPGFRHAKPYRRYAIPTLTSAEVEAVLDYVLGLAGQKTDPANALIGRALYRNKAQCFDCHEMDAKGDSFIGAPNLIDKVWLYGDGSRASVRASIDRGRAGVCPAWADKLKPAVIRALAVLIHQRAAPASAEDKPS